MRGGFAIKYYNLYPGAILIGGRLFAILLKVRWRSAMIKPEHVLEFWFAGCDDNKALESRQVNKWVNRQGFTADFIVKNFGRVIEQAESGMLDEWKKSPEGSLALILLFDVFTRYAHAGSQNAFKNDRKALDVLEHAMTKGFDKKWTILQRMHGYLPYEHAEDHHLQNKSVELYAALSKAAPVAIKKWVDAALCTAIAHRDVIEKFGRFPQRNAMVHRRTSPQELTFAAVLKRSLTRAAAATQ